MNFPEQVIFRLVDNKTKKTVQNIAVLLILYAHKKNNYSIEAKISNNNGEVIFTKKDCLEGIKSSKSFYLMDYASSLEECLSQISLKILSRKTIDFVIDDRKNNKDIYSGYWDTSESFLNALKNTDNHHYVDKTYNFSESDLWQNKILEIQLANRAEEFREFRGHIT